MKFTKTGSVIFRVKSCDSAEKIQTLHFEIEDTGIGITTDHLETIFDSFNQASKSVDETTGTGLGLIITRQFVDQMGGRIEVESKINKGSLFRFNIKIESTNAS